jgi:hypothetical protein
MLTRGFKGFTKIGETLETIRSSTVVRSATVVKPKPNVIKLGCIRPQDLAKVAEFFVTVITSLRNLAITAVIVITD